MITSKSSVCVAIVTRSRRDSFGQLVACLAAQTRVPDEVMVVENTFESQNVSDHLLQKALPDTCKTTYFSVVKETISAGYSRNICLKHAQSDILIFLDDDVIIGNDFISKTVKWFSTFSDALAITPKIVSTTDDVWSQFSELFFAVGQQHETNPIVRKSFSTCACALNLTALRKTGVIFDTALPEPEDFVFSKQALLVSGKKNMYVPDLAVSHIFSLSNPFRTFLRRFNWYTKNCLPSKIKYSELLKNDMKYIDYLVPQRKIHLIFFPVFVWNVFFSEIRSVYSRYHLTWRFFIPCVIYVFLAIHNTVFHAKYYTYLKPHLRKIVRQTPLLFSFLRM